MGATLTPLSSFIATSGGFRNIETGETVVKPSPGPVGWTPFYTYTLTSDSGWSQYNGNRALDSSYNRAANTTFGAGGMTITAQRASVGATIFSSDASARFKPLPDYFAIEADISLDGYVGKGCFPAFWIRPISGQGEIDIFELMSNQDDGNSHYKGTAILTTNPPGYNVGNKAIQYDTSDGNIITHSGTTLVARSPAGFHTYRLEKIPNKFTYYVDNVLMGSITQAQVDAQATTSSKWANQFEAGQQWYARLTYQFGPPTDGRNFNAGGTPPDTWFGSVTSSMTCSRMRVWQYQAP